MQFIRFPKTLDYDWITISDEMLESTLTVFRTTFRANIKYDRRQNERTIIHQLRSEEHTSELQSLMRISYAVFCLKKKKPQKTRSTIAYSYTTNKQTEMNT